MKNLTPEFAEILGLLCAEGSYIKSYCSYWGRERGKPRYYKNKKSERIEFSNEDKLLLSHYQKLISKEFNYTPQITKHNKINICRGLIIELILGYTELGHIKWRVPLPIMNSDKPIKISFLRGYFDGDGTASNLIRMFSSNKKGLKEVSYLLNQLSITHTFQGPILKRKRKPSYIIQISRNQKEKFLNIVKPVSKRPDKLRG